MFFKLYLDISRALGTLKYINVQWLYAAVNRFEIIVYNLSGWNKNVFQNTNHIHEINVLQGY